MCRSCLYLVSLCSSSWPTRAVDQGHGVADHSPKRVSFQGGHVFSGPTIQMAHLLAERLDPDVEDGGGGKAPRGGGEG